MALWSFKPLYKSHKIEKTRGPLETRTLFLPVENVGVNFTVIVKEVIKDARMSERKEDEGVEGGGGGQFLTLLPF